MGLMVRSAATPRVSNHDLQNAVAEGRPTANKKAPVAGGLFAF